MIYARRNLTVLVVYEYPRCAICCGMCGDRDTTFPSNQMIVLDPDMNVPETFSIHLPVAVHCGLFQYAQCFEFTLRNEHLHIIAIIISSLRASILPPVTIKNIPLYMWTSTHPSSTPCAICARRFPLHSENSHSVMELIAVKV